jgi:hypothetical protein
LITSTRKKHVDLASQNKSRVNPPSIAAALLSPVQISNHKELPVHEPSQIPEPLADCALHSHLKQMVKTEIPEFQKLFCSKLIEQIDTLTVRKPLQGFGVADSFEKILKAILDQNHVLTHEQITPIFVLYLQFCEWAKSQHIPLIFQPAGRIEGNVRVLIQTVYSEFIKQCIASDENDIKSIIYNISKVIFLLKKDKYTDLIFLKKNPQKCTDPLMQEVTDPSISAKPRKRTLQTQRKKRKRQQKEKTSNKRPRQSESPTLDPASQTLPSISWPASFQNIFSSQDFLRKNRDAEIASGSSIPFASAILHLKADQRESLRHLDTLASQNIKGILSYDKGCGKAGILTARIVQHVIAGHESPILFITSDSSLSKIQESLIAYFERAQCSVAVSTFLNWDKIPLEERDFKGRMIINWMKRLNSTSQFSETRQDKRNTYISKLLQLMPKGVQENLGRLVLNPSVEISIDKKTPGYDCDKEVFQRLLSFNPSQAFQYLKESALPVNSSHLVLFTTYKSLNSRIEQYISQNRFGIVIFDRAENMKRSEQIPQLLNHLNQREETTLIPSLSRFPKDMFSLMDYLEMINPQFFSIKLKKELKTSFDIVKRSFQNEKINPKQIIQSFLQIHIASNIMKYFVLRKFKEHSSIWDPFLFSSHLSDRFKDFSLLSLEAHLLQFLSLLAVQAKIPDEMAEEFSKEICTYLHQNQQDIEGEFQRIASLPIDVEMDQSH